jgi:hypothetical protein
MDIKESDILGDDINNHWYYKLKSDFLLKSIGKEKFSVVTDIGAGSGYFSKRLLTAGIIKEAICVDTAYTADHKSVWGQGEIKFQKSIQSIPKGLVLMMDVLEHIEDDFLFLKSHLEISPVGTKFFISVPAFQFLFSSHDIFLEHHRRYTLSELKLLCEKSGLKVISVSYFYATLFPIVALLRIIKKMKLKFFNNPNHKSELSKHNSLINSILYYIHIPELYIQKFNSFFGLSIMLIAVKE